MKFSCSNSKVRQNILIAFDRQSPIKCSKLITLGGYHWLNKAINQRHYKSVHKTNYRRKKPNIS